MAVSAGSDGATGWLRSRIINGVAALIGIGLLAGAAGVAPRARADQTLARAPVDADAMREALESNAPSGPLGSAEAYLHYLEGNLEADRGDHAAAVKAYRETLALDGSATHVRLRLALEYWRLGQSEEAEAAALSTASDDPGSAEAHEVLGTFYLQESRPQAAAKELAKAVGLDPQLTEAYRSLVQARLALGDVRAAERALDLWATANPDEGLGWREFGELLLAHGDLPRAKKFLDRALKYRPEDPPALAALGRLAEQRGQPDQAMAFFERSLRADPEDPTVLFALGQHHLRKAALAKDPASEIAAARGCFNSLVAMAPDEATARVQVAFAYLKANQDSEALRELDRATLADSQGGRARYIRGEVEYQMGHLAEAVQDLESVPQEDEAYADARYKLGFALFKLHRIDEAIEALRVGLSARPDAIQLTTELAKMLGATGRGGEAVKLLEQALDPSDRRPELVEALADAYEDVGRRHDAIVLLRRVLKGKPGQGQLRFSLGAKLQRSGDFEGAVATMRELLKFEPRNADALNFIGKGYAERGIHLSEAEKLVNQALAVEPTNGVFADSLGWVYFRRGKLRQAIETLQRASRFAPEHAAIAEHLGDVYQATGDPALALQNYGRALRILDAHPDPELAADLKRKLEGLKARTASTE